MDSTSKRRKLRSAVWDYFEPFEDRTSAVCKLCQLNETVKTNNGSTSGLHRHLKTKHNIDVNFESDLEIDSGHQSNSTGKEIVDLQEGLSRLSSLDGMSFLSISSSSTLRQLFLSNGCREFPGSPSTVRNMVLTFFSSKKEELRQRFQNMVKSGKKFSVSIDEWTSCGRRRYMNINVHAGNGIVWNLGLARITGSLTADNAMDLLKSKLAEYGLQLDDHIVAIVTDGAANMKRLGTMFSGNHQLCFAHGIHLAVTDVLYQKKPESNEILESDIEVDDLMSTFIVEENEPLDLEVSIEEIVKKVRNIVKYFHVSPLKTETLLKYTRESNKKEVSLILDCKTRWNSLLDMLERFYRLRHDVQKALIDLGEPLEITNQECKKIEEIVNLLAPVKVAVEAICRRNASLVTCDAILGFVLKKFNASESQLGQNLKEAFLKRVTERRSILSELATYLNSIEIYKSKRSSGFYPSTKNQLAEKIKQLYRVILLSEECSEPLVQIVDESLSCSPLEVCLESELNQAILEVLSASQKPASSNDKSTMSTIKREMAFYESGEGKGRILEAVHSYIMTIPPSTVESERAFSCATSFCTKIRSRLGDDTLDALVFLKYYFLSL